MDAIDWDRLRENNIANNQFKYKRTRKRRPRGRSKKGPRNPEWDQLVVDYYNQVHSIKETAIHFNRCAPWIRHVLLRAGVDIVIHRTNVEKNRAKKRDKARKQYHAEKEAGICRRCHKRKATMPRRLCAECHPLNKLRESKATRSIYHKLVAQELCPRCRQSTDVKGQVYCTRCLVYYRDAQRKHKMKVEGS